MPAISATAPGKIILFGEHAVVYNRPAIAVPISKVRARAIITANPRGKPGAVRVVAPNIGLNSDLDELPHDEPLVAAIQSVLSALKLSTIPACNIRITSTIPIAAGMGSGAAVTISVIRALSSFLGHTLPDEQVSKLTFNVERIHHGTPSGIDNSVIAFNKPVYYIRNQPIQTLDVPQPLIIIIGDTGIPSPTAITVRDVRHSWQDNPALYDGIFDQISKIVQDGQKTITSGDFKKLGYLMDKNHEHLQLIGVSSSELDHLVSTSKSAGALGAKLSGGGRGGNMIALVTPELAEKVANSLQKEGAVNTIISIIDSTK